MKKFNLMSILSVILVFSLVGCGSKAKEKDISTAEASKYIIENVEFKDSLVEAEGDVAANYYELGHKITEYSIYISGSGATAEEIAVLKVENKADIMDVENIIKLRIETLTAMFENYRPDEMVKIKNHYVETRGNIVYLVIADDTGSAKDAIAALYE